LIDDDFVRVIGNEYGGAPGSVRKYQIVLNRLTTSISATPRTSARAGTHAREGWHGCAETASAHASQTVIEPSLTVRQISKAKITLSPNGDFENLDEYLEAWKKAYPHLDVATEIRKAGAWLITNPERKRKNLARFLNGWLSRSNSAPADDIMAGVT
jgi:hypothetical protein